MNAAKRRAERRAEEGSGDFSRTFNRPDGIERFELRKAGVRRIALLPYKVGKGNPYADPGETYYERTFWTHYGLGPSGKDSHICLQQTLGKKCPICQDIEKMKRNGVDYQLWKGLRPKERQLFLVYDYDDKEKGVQLWEISNHNFGKQLDDRLNNEDPEDNWSDFYLPGKKGLILRLTVIEDKVGTNPFFRVSTIDFKTRKAALSLQHDVCLDELLSPIKYDELKAIYLQDDSEDEDDDTGADVDDETADDDDDAPWDEEEEEEETDSEEEYEYEEEDGEEDDADDWEEDDDSDDDAEEDDDWEDEEEGDEDADDDDDWGDDDDEGSDEEEDDDDDWGDDDDEEEEEPVRTPRKKAAKRVTPRKKAAKKKTAKKAARKKAAKKGTRRR